MISAASIPTCPVCKGGRRGRSYWRAANILQCRKCELLYKIPFPTENDLESFYESSWDKPQQNTAETGNVDLNLARQYVRSLARSIGRSDFRGMRLLEIGAGRGALLEAMGELGAECYAIEPYGHDNLMQQGYSVFRAFEKLPAKLEFDGIVSMDVIEHLRDPWTMVAKARDRLKLHGWFMLATPNAHGLSARIRRGEWREARKPGHIILFKPKILRRLLLQCGFGRPQRLTWDIRYSESPIRTAIHNVLALLGLEGHLRYIVWKV